MLKTVVVTGGAGYRGTWGGMELLEKSRLY
jgi:hypothetical protein